MHVTASDRSLLRVLVLGLIYRPASDDFKLINRRKGLVLVRQIHEGVVLLARDGYRDGIDTAGDKALFAEAGLRKA